ncbi:ChrR family anti-sigma-E factor [Puniceibacterium confluentis]|uniref:ChrR family anti-sigma-E factor n=2 Tax=Puniceibacterium confluentis TaxID=1958944 RepID=UPI0011B407D3|nr:ChrR family anti-sigma-E factor [Puniceibacterium confluentis]
MITHHPTPDFLMAYSAGSLPEAFDLIVATHLSLCDTCRAEVGSYDALGGALLDTTAAAELTGSGIDRLLTGITSDRLPGDDSAAPPSADPDLPVPLAAYVGARLKDVRWRPVGMGVKQAILPTAPGATARLLFIPAGTAVPDHGHRGTELTLVLRGAFEDCGGRFARGDVELATPETDHMPIADITEDCICLAVTDAPLRFKGLLPRLVQPFLKI